MTGPRQVAVPRLLRVGPGVIDDLGDLLIAQFDVEETIIVSGAAASAAHADSVAAQLAKRQHSVRRIDDPDGTTASVTTLVESIDQRPATLIVAVGGGRPVDVAKLAASRAHADLVVVPTVLSHDGLCSPVASLVAGDGRRRSLPAVTPTGVVVDTKVVADAPSRFLQAGVGDLVSNITAVQDWRIAAAATGEAVDELAASIALTGALSVLDLDWPPTDGDIETIARGLLLSGIAMEIAKSSRPCSGAEHLVSHALDAHHPDGHRLHGEQVALGTLLAACAQTNDAETRISSLLDRIGLTARVREWSRSVDLAPLLDAAPATRPGRYTVLDELEGRGWTASTLVRAVRERGLR